MISQIETGFFQGVQKRFLGDTPSTFSGANDSRGGDKIFLEENEIFMLES